MLCVGGFEFPIIVMVYVPEGVPDDPCLAVVWIARLELAEPVLGEMPPGENWHFDAAGNPEQDRLTL